jgi:hypothetical protein
MIRILLPLTMAILSGTTALAAPRSFTCLPQDFASTEMTFVQRGEVLQLTLASRALDTWAEGVLYALPPRNWKMQKLTLEFPIASCRFHATEKSVFQCNPTNVTATVEQLADFDIPATAPPQKTFLNWAFFSVAKVVTEYASGETSTSYPLHAYGYGQEGDFAIKTVDCVAD